MTRARATADTQDNNGGAVAPFVAGKNRIINGDFGIWQRGTSFSTSPNTETFTADRFYVNRNGSGATVTVSRQSFTPGTAPVSGYEGNFFYRFDQSVAGSGATYSIIAGERVEDVRTFAGQTVTFSFWAKADSNRNIVAEFLQYFGPGGGSNASGTSTVALTTSWARYSVTFNIPSVAGKTINAGNYISFSFLDASLNTTKTVDTWGWQVEAGSVATPFTTASGTLAGELQLAQRYYYPICSGTANDFNFPVARVSTTLAEMTLFLPVPLRTTPSLVLTSVGGVFGRLVGFDTSYNATVVNVTSVGLGTSTNTQMITIGFTNGSMTAAASAGSAQFDNANAASTIALSAEL